MTSVHRAHKLRINGDAVTVEADDDASLLSVLRGDLGLRGARAGCGVGDCGACTVAVDGTPTQSCTLPLASAAGCEITTPEGLGGPDDPHPVQQVFLDQQAGQCGYCVNGVVMTAWALAEAGQRPTAEVVEAALDSHICRCGAQGRLKRAVGDVLGVELAGAAVPASRVELPLLDSPAASPPPEITDNPAVEDWIRLTPEGGIVVADGKSEIGQGVHVAMAQIAAANLGVDVALVTTEDPRTDEGPANGYTSGSRSLQDAGASMAMAAAAFRRLLLDRAAAALDVAADQLHVVAHGAVAHRETDESLSFAELAAQGAITGPISAQDEPDWSAPGLGASVARADLRRKLTGSPAFAHDLALPGMLHARAVLPPTYEATLEHVDTTGVQAMAGVVAVLQDGRLLVVVAEQERQAVKAAEALHAKARWGEARLDVDGDAVTTLRSLPHTPLAAREDPVDEALQDGRSLSASYSKPYHAHGAIAPSCALALAGEDGLDVWSHTQGVHPQRSELAALFDEDPARIRVHHVDGPGCYGQNAADDAAALAAFTARSLPGRPVRVQLSLQDEFGWEPYGSAMGVDLAAALDEGGRIAAWRNTAYTDAQGARPRGQGDRLAVAWLRKGGAPRPWPGPAAGATRNILPIYDIEAVHAVAQHARGPLRTGSLRGLASFMHVFATESFIDELAEAAGLDPLAFRLANLRDQRARDVLEQAAAAAGWRPHVGPSGRGQGLSVARYHDRMGYAAVVADAAFDQETGAVQVRRLVVACDAGAVVNADGLKNQVEGGALQGVSRTMCEAAVVDGRGIRSLDWESYPTLRMRDTPTVETVLVDRPGMPPLGAGEAVTPVVPAAIANAVDDAVGLRLRDLPFTPAQTQRRMLDLNDAELRRVRLG